MPDVHANWPRTMENEPSTDCRCSRFTSSLLIGQLPQPPPAAATLIPTTLSSLLANVVHYLADVALFASQCLLLLAPPPMRLHITTNHDPNP